MCRVLYVAANHSLPLRPWNPERPGFHVTEVPDDEAAVKAHFSKPHVVYIGSHEGCGCGFDVENASISEPDQVDAARQSRGHLVAYLRSNIKRGESLELYTCWDGDWHEPPSRRVVIVPETLAPEQPWLQERTFATITAAAA